MSSILLLTACGGSGSSSSAAPASVASAPASAAPSSEAPAPSEAASVADPEPASEPASEAASEEYFSQDFELRNDTGVDILELYISPSNEENWGSDLLGEDIFAADTTVTFTTDLVGTADATWDIKIVDADGDEVSFPGVNLSEASTISLHWGEDGATPTAETVA